jgi:hypothetical protein
MILLSESEGVAMLTSPISEKEHFNLRLFNHELFNPRHFNHELLALGLKSLGFKSSWLKLEVEKSEV